MRRTSEPQEARRDAPQGVSITDVEAILRGAGLHEEADRLLPLLKDGPAVFEKLTGRRPHRSALQRWATTGAAGIPLKVAAIGGERLTTARWCAKWMLAVGEARS